MFSMSPRWCRMHSFTTEYVVFHFGYTNNGRLAAFPSSQSTTYQVAQVDEMDIKQPTSSSYFGTSCRPCPNTHEQCPRPLFQVGQGAWAQNCAHTNQMNWTLGLNMLRSEPGPLVWKDLKSTHKRGKHFSQLLVIKRMQHVHGIQKTINVMANCFAFWKIYSRAQSQQDG